MPSSDGKLGGNIVMIVAIVLGLTTAGSWMGRSTDRSTAESGSGRATRALERKGQPADAPPVTPTPVMRPLALIANAIGPDPLFLLDEPGKPSLAASYAGAVTPSFPKPCARMLPHHADRDGDWDSTFQKWRLQDSECALIARMREKSNGAGF